MKKYVTCIAFNYSLTKTILLKKNNKYEFLAGKMIPPGGSVEDGETIYEAAAREFKEECGIETSELSWVYVGTLNVEKDGIIKSNCDYLKTYLPDDILETATTMEEEEVSVVNISALNLTYLDADIMCMLAAALSKGCDALTIQPITRYIKSVY